YERYDISGISARFIRINGHGNSENAFTSLTEVGFYQNPNIPTDVAPESDASGSPVAPDIAPESDASGSPATPDVAPESDTSGSPAAPDGSDG
ncbi:MAG: hypothetical protein K6T85_14280, partial [Gorillibacterium sp.]|nr:hypothetical protein [Gorillibacterium sp.]